MRLIAWFILISTLVLATWLLWGGTWETWFTLEGAIARIESAGPWAWAAGIVLLAADVILPVPGTVVMSALGWIYGIFAGGLIAAAGSITAAFITANACASLGLRCMVSTLLGVKPRVPRKK